MHQKDEEKRLQVLKWIKLLEDFILRVFTDFFRRAATLYDRVSKPGMSVVKTENYPRKKGQENSR